MTHSAEGQLPVILHETFDDNKYGWFEGETEEYKVILSGGKYRMEAPEGGWMSYLSPYVEPQKDFSIEATFTQMDGENNGIGFIWGFDGKNGMNNFTFASNGFFRLFCSDPSLSVSDEWRETNLVKPLGQENKLKVEQIRNVLTFYINGEKVATTRGFPWKGKYVGFVAYAKMKLLIDDYIFKHDIHINLPRQFPTTGVRENLGPNVNSKFEEVSPNISSDGRTLYFGRKYSPENVGGVRDKGDIWESHTSDGVTWSRSKNLGEPINTSMTNNLVSVSTDNNTFLFHINDGFAFRHRTATGWSPLQDLGIRFKNESDFLEASLSPDGKALLFVAKLKANAFYRVGQKERDIYVCVKKSDGTWSSPIHTGKVLNSPGDEYSPFLSADNKTLYFASNGRPGYGHVDIFMSRRLTDGWTQWSEPVNLGLGINTVGFDAYYTLPASGDYGYMVSNIKSVGLADIIRFKLPEMVKPDPVVLVEGKVLNGKTHKPLEAVIRFDDLSTGKEGGEARSDPRTGDYRIVLPSGKKYGYHAEAAGYLSVNENLELVELEEYGELRKDLLLVPIEIGESIQLKNVFFIQSQAVLMPESYPELDRLVRIMMDNATIEIQLEGHTDGRGDPQANLLLSERRVEAVKQYLISKGISEKRIVGKGFGGAKPMVSNDTEENRKLNRRVEFKITKK
ncbi:MAG TPA: OmpA family protein [Chryseosolibacter sp.]|nr:OmpA family protein [Chryseosolibacter sp.]